MHTVYLFICAVEGENFCILTEVKKWHLRQKFLHSKLHPPNQTSGHGRLKGGSSNIFAAWHVSREIPYHRWRNFRGVHHFEELEAGENANSQRSVLFLKETKDVRWEGERPHVSKLATLLQRKVKTASKESSTAIFSRHESVRSMHIPEHGGWQKKHRILWPISRGFSFPCKLPPSWVAQTYERIHSTSSLSDGETKVMLLKKAGHDWSASDMAPISGQSPQNTRSDLPGQSQLERTHERSVEGCRSRILVLKTLKKTRGTSIKERTPSHPQNRITVPISEFKSPLLIDQGKTAFSSTEQHHSSNFRIQIPALHRYDKTKHRRFGEDQKKIPPRHLWLRVRLR